MPIAAMFALAFVNCRAGVDVTVTVAEGMRRKLQQEKKS